VSAAINEKDSRRILLIDDDEGTIQSYSRQLRLEGYEVHTAGNVEMGLFEALFNRPDAIIVDFHMPLADGLAFLRRLRLQSGQGATPVAIMTGDFFLDDDVESEIQTLGARIAYKPLPLDDLLSLTRTLLR
jgi:two-component system OmpR family response regulator